MRSEEMMRKVLLDTIGASAFADGSYPEFEGDDVLGILKKGSKGRAVNLLSEPLPDCGGGARMDYEKSVSWWDDQVEIIHRTTEYGEGWGYPSTRYLKERPMTRGEFLFYAKARARDLGIDLEWN